MTPESPTHKHHRCPEVLVASRAPLLILQPVGEGGVWLWHPMELAPKA
jgi:hypothetical protein